MNIVATVLHNVSEDMFLRFNPKTSKLFHAHTFQVIADNADTALEVVWTVANVDEDMLRSDMALYRPQLCAYRERMNRSLSVSDVVFLAEHPPNGEPRPLGAHVVEMVGWRMLDPVPPYTMGSNEGSVSQSYLAHQRRFQEFNQ